MRIISGIYRGRKLKTPVDMKIRPTSDRLRETLFNIISHRIENDSVTLDLCAGTGAIGIEALSRGCLHSIFVDSSRQSFDLVSSNLKLLEIPKENAKVFCSSAEAFIKNTSSQFDFVYFDPPYEMDYTKVLSELGDSNSLILKKKSVVVVEHYYKTNILETYGELQRWRLIKQGDSCLSFFEKNLK
jgi:16S rRNA (guanine966-N2)-methyltransferase